jgi:predicted nucleic acid-binding protein
MIVDTSVWIDVFRNNLTPKVEFLRNYISVGKQPCITSTILQEVLQGVRDEERYKHIKEGILANKILTLDPVEAAIGAADLYRSLRKKGVTIRKPNDCLIAYHALVHDLPVLHNDVDFDQIARHTALRVVSL